MESRENFEKFRDDNFLAYNTLNEKTVMEYFYSSRFFDVTSLNQKGRKGLEVSSTAEGLAYRLIFYKQTPGANDIVALGGNISSQWTNYPNQFGVYVIQKYIRDAKGTETPLECYYVLGGTIYKSPSLGTLLRQRSLTAVKQLESLLDTLTSMSDWSLVEGYSWGGGLACTSLTETEDGVFEELKSSSDNLLTAVEDKKNITIEDSKKRPCPEDSRLGDELFGVLNPSSTMINDLYTKRPCSDANRIIEDCFASFANASLRFNEHVDKIRLQWHRTDENWQQEQLTNLQT